LSLPVCYLKINIKIGPSQPVIEYVFFYRYERESLKLRGQLKLTATKNKMLSRIFGPEPGSSRRLEELYSEVVHNLCSPPLITAIIKWRTMKRSIGKIRNAYKILFGMSAGRDNSENLDVDRINFKWILKE
jgi:hypothetical protein